MMKDITTIDSLALLTVFGKENYSSKNEFDTDKLNFQETDKVQVRRPPASLRINSQEKETP